jgi:hypothetical protein
MPAATAEPMYGRSKRKKNLRVKNHKIKDAPKNIERMVIGTVYLPVFIATCSLFFIKQKVSKPSLHTKAATHSAYKQNVTDEGCTCITCIISFLMASDNRFINRLF